MRNPRVFGLFVASLSAALALGVTAAQAAQTFDSPQDCAAHANAGVGQGCTSFDGHHWVLDQPGGGGAGGGAFGAFIVIALLWSAAPAVIGGLVAASRDQSVGLAVLLGIFLGWVGLLIVAFVLKPEVTNAARTIITEHQAPRPVASVPPRPVAERLTELEELKDRGLVAWDEYAKRRDQILSDI